MKMQRWECGRKMNYDMEGHMTCGDVERGINFKGKDVLTRKREMEELSQRMGRVGEGHCITWHG